MPITRECLRNLPSQGLVIKMEQERELRTNSTQIIYDAESGNRTPGHISGRRVLLRHPWRIFLCNRRREAPKAWILAREGQVPHKSHSPPYTLIFFV